MVDWMGGLGWMMVWRSVQMALWLAVQLERLVRKMVDKLDLKLAATMVGHSANESVEQRASELDCKKVSRSA